MKTTKHKQTSGPKPPRKADRQQELSDKLAKLRTALISRVLVNIKSPKNYAIPALQRRVGDLEAVVAAILTIVDPAAAKIFDKGRFDGAVNVKGQQMLRVRDTQGTDDHDSVEADGLVKVLTGANPCWELGDDVIYGVTALCSLFDHAFFGHLYHFPPCSCGETDARVSNDKDESMLCTDCGAPRGCPNCHKGPVFWETYPGCITCSHCGTTYLRPLKTELPQHRPQAELCLPDDQYDVPPAHRRRPAPEPEKDSREDKRRRKEAVSIQA